MKFRWSVAPPQATLAAELASVLNIPLLLAQCLVNRGLSEPAHCSSFLEPRLRHLADPFLIPGMVRAVERLFVARQNREPLVVFGDYDVDGVTSSALLLEVFQALGLVAHCYLPHRLEEGYGLSQEAVENCLKKFPVSLLLAVDCGSTSVRSIDYLRSRAIDVIVLDHHQVSSPTPAACALVNPQAAGVAASGSSSPARLPFAELCSVGLSFKLAHALVKRGREAGLTAAAEFDLRPLLDLVALGTIADLVPLTGENRLLVSPGLERLNSTRRPGLVALKQVAQCHSPLSPVEVAFQLAPRLNAAGRLETAEAALHLLLARTLDEALPLARELDSCNRERQKLERHIADEALKTVRASFEPEKHFVIVQGQAPWHVGVVGIVASRVLQQFYRPTLILGGDGIHYRGSGRSIAGFDLAAALRQCADLLVNHGGHALAAGVTLLPEKLDEFRQRLNDLARQALSPEALQPVLRLDAEVNLRELNLECVQALSKLHPVGQGNPSVQFSACNLSQPRACQRMGADKQHVKMWVSNGGPAFEAVWWSAGKAALPSGPFDLAFAPQINEYNGNRAVQLKVLDWREATA